MYVRSVVVGPPQVAKIAKGLGRITLVFKETKGRSVVATDDVNFC